MDLVKCLLLVIILNYVSTEPSHSDKHEDAFHSILETLKLNNTLLRLQDVNVILTKLGLIHDCSNATKHKCVTAESLFKIFNISTTSSVNEEEFSKFAPIIVYALLPNEQHSQDHTEDGDHDEHDDDDHDQDHDGDLDDDENDGDHDKHDDDHDDHDNEKQITQNVDVYKEFLERYET
ncbi:---NA---, partial [Paramuricea clavata]